jgi:hypothetical protein
MFIERAAQPGFWTVHSDVLGPAQACCGHTHSKAWLDWLTALHRPFRMWQARFATDWTAISICPSRRDARCEFVSTYQLHAELRPESADEQHSAVA